MKANRCLEKRTALLAAPAIVLMLLPGLIAARSSKLDFPVSHVVSVGAAEIQFMPEHGWTIEQVRLEKDGRMVPVETAHLSLNTEPEFSAGVPERFQITCQREKNGTVREQNVIYSVLRERDGSVTVEAYPEENSSVSFHYSYPEQGAAV